MPDEVPVTPPPMTRERAREIIRELRGGIRIVRSDRPRHRIDAKEWGEIFRQVLDVAGAIATSAMDGKLTAEEAEAISRELFELGQVVRDAKAD